MNGLTKFDATLGVSAAVSRVLQGGVPIATKSAKKKRQKASARTDAGLAIEIANPAITESVSRRRISPTINS